MKFSIIIPSYNQPRYIERTLQNVTELKSVAAQHGYTIEILILDNCSTEDVSAIIKKHQHVFDYIEIANDKGQFDAINKGIGKITGDYWTWLNTDDYIDIKGFIKLADILKGKPEIDYIYGGIDIIDENDQLIRTARSYDLSMNYLLHRNPSIFQPGSFFKKKATDAIGLLQDNKACFDYEYILRLLAHKALFFNCGFTVAQFRYYAQSKSGSITPVFIREQLRISKKYGRRTLSFMNIFLRLRLVKHFLFSMK